MRAAHPEDTGALDPRPAAWGGAVRRVEHRLTVATPRAPDHLARACTAIPTENEIAAISVAPCPTAGRDVPRTTVRRSQLDLAGDAGVEGVVLPMDTVDNSPRGPDVGSRTAA